MKVKERVMASFTMIHNFKPTVCINVRVNKLFIPFDPVKVKVETVIQRQDQAGRRLNLSSLSSYN